MANEKNIEVVENKENKNVTEYVPEKTMMDKIKEFRLGEKGKKILTSIGVAAGIAVGFVAGAIFGKNRGEDDETPNYVPDEEQDCAFEDSDDDWVE